MSLRDCRATAQALFRVFVRPTATLQQTPHLCRPPALPPSHAQTRRISISPWEKQRYGPKRSNTAAASPTAHVVDDQIGVRYIDLVRPDGSFEREVDLPKLLRKTERIQEHVILLKPADKNNLDSLPVCKLVTKTELRKLQHRAQELEKLRKKQEKANKGKMLEIGWGTDNHDLVNTKMKYFKEFLSSGKKVEVVLLKKAGKKVPDHEYCQHVLDTVRATAAEIEGTKEYKSQEGALGRELMLFYQGPTKAIKASNASN
ncbi:hypothetical protein EJ05DRAFT_509790 [Pseudovirgaria hyperparasitica]|uniref:Translation initiation factor 3 N-terminal domain-containing protein n=1 Tax=Pseudovirgaria hyperparasitica TaxID=470096 RepID=A0A6A6WAB9_9PEZI|nr:uncharacterized protein EJ05DRAFT_509790 [Pseudovirgaria hyperparasitica]KAF2758900.1 hypothetical protein EJ05DRAFT_509790 [Pseudovirgaria hyperparasitica]